MQDLHFSILTYYSLDHYQTCRSSNRRYNPLAANAQVATCIHPNASYKIVVQGWLQTQIQQLLSSGIVKFAGSSASRKELAVAGAI